MLSVHIKSEKFVTVLSNQLQNNMIIFFFCIYPSKLANCTSYLESQRFLFALVSVDPELKLPKLSYVDSIKCWLLPLCEAYLRYILQNGYMYILVFKILEEIYAIETPPCYLFLVNISP